MQTLKQAIINIQGYLDNTPIISSSILNQMLNHNIYFKVDALQKTGAFKVRGVLNHLIELKNLGKLPKKIVCYSTGNHAIGVSWVSQQLALKSRIYLPSDTAEIKSSATKFYGADVLHTSTRKEAEIKAKDDGKNGYYFIHPSASDTIIAGAGTMCYEALQDMIIKPDAIFASIGGGGLISGTYLAKESLSKNSKVYGAEPCIADDAYLSKQNNRIISNNISPNTIADGLRTLQISDKTFEYIKKIDGIYRVSEEEIGYYNAWLIHLLKVTVEPSSACAMAAAVKWLREQTDRKNILVLISGGNVDPILYSLLSEKEYLSQIPKL